MGKMQDFKRWLISSAQVYTDVDVTPFLTAEQYYNVLATLIGKTARGDVIFLCDWEIDVKQALGAESSGAASVEQVLTEAAKRKVGIRALFDFDQKELLAKAAGDPLPFRAAKNREGVQAVRDLGGNAALDDQQRLFGSHHQKLAFIQAGKSTYGFCGGIDIARRWPWRDVQCQIKGGAAGEILATLTERWNSLHGVKSIPRSVPPISGAVSAHANNYVQVVRTYGKEDFWAKDKRRLYAQSGEYGVHAMVANAVAKVSRFIYVEDQYLFQADMKSKAHIGDLIARRLASVPNLIFIAIISRTEHIEGEVEQAWFRRKELIERISRGVSDAAHRVRVFQYKSNLTAAFGKNFIHTKMWVFDDEFAVIGSANFNRRGYTHDGEFALGIAGKDLFARKLRTKKWLQHLKVGGNVTEEEISEWPKGLEKLEGSQSPFERYNVDGGLDAFGKTPNEDANDRWFNVIDPDGS